jgi:hypothetical protein
VVLLITAIGTTGYFAYQARQNKTDNSTVVTVKKQPITSYHSFEKAGIKVPAAGLDDVKFKENQDSSGTGYLVSYGNTVTADHNRTCINKHKSDFITPSYDQVLANADYTGGVFVYPGKYTQPDGPSTSILIKQLTNKYILRSLGGVEDCPEDTTFINEKQKLNDKIDAALKQAIEL